MNRRLTALAKREGGGYAALCPEVDVVGQGNTVAEALTLFFETAGAGEVERRLHSEAASIAATATGRIDIAGGAADACPSTRGCHDQSD